jgi:hypothetical protein
MELKTLDLKSKEFTANGKNYIISDKISIERYMEYQKLSPLLTFGTNFEEMFIQLKRAYAHLNKQNFADSSVIIHNLLTSVGNVEQTSRVHPALKMAALFINREDEDCAVYNEELTNAKIADWTKEGFNISDFFTLALNSISGFRQAYQEYIEKNQAEQE